MGSVERFCQTHRIYSRYWGAQMDSLAWTESLSVGHELIDSHHKKLFSILDELIACVDQGGGIESIRRVLSELIEYAKYHFSTEEEILVQANYPFLDLHRHSHQTISVRIAEMMDKMDADNYSHIAVELHVFLVGWLVHHIEIEDFEFRPYISQTP
jgi:hemerythrin